MPDTKVLVVDDSSTMRRIIISSLNKLQFNRVAQASDGVDALEKLDADIGLVITDWNMPEMDGLEFVNTVRKDPQFAKLPVIMLTTEAGKSEIAEAVKMGVSDYIVKPFTIKVLRDKIQSALSVELAEI